LMTPKSLLRNPLAASTLTEFTSGTFHPVLDDPLTKGREAEITRLVFCSGKVAVDLEASPLRAEASRVAVARVEQLAPFQQTAIRQTIDQYPNLQQVVWLQEEPQNMGSWTFMETRLRKLLTKELDDRSLSLDYIGRPERASPAEGSADLHSANQGRIITEAFSNAPEPVAAPKKTNGRATARAAKNGVETTSNGATTKAEKKTSAQAAD